MIDKDGFEIITPLSLKVNVKPASISVLKEMITINSTAYKKLGNPNYITFSINRVNKNLKMNREPDTVKGAFKVYKDKKRYARPYILSERLADHIRESIGMKGRNSFSVISKSSTNENNTLIFNLREYKMITVRKEDE